MKRKLKASAAVLATTLGLKFLEIGNSIMAGLSPDKLSRYQQLPLQSSGIEKGGASSDYGKLRPTQSQYSGSKGLSQAQAEGLRRKRFVVSTQV